MIAGPANTVYRETATCKRRSEWMRVLCIKNEPHETPGAIAAWCRERGHALSIIELYAGAQPPATDSLDLLLVMGGPMSVNDDRIHPWLKTEKQFMGECVAAGRKILGICLGSQLLASVLGARVYRNTEKEIGWFPVTLTMAGKSSSLFSGQPESFDMFHWHGDIFDLPRGAERLAFSEVTERQAFAVAGRLVGLQFHPEIDDVLLDGFVNAGREELVPARFVQSPEEILSRRGLLAGLNRCLRGILAGLEE
jgi:GMP synthase-like glutamine amidotransferase